MGNIAARNGNISGHSITAAGHISGVSITSTEAISGGTVTSTGYLAITATTGRPTIPPALGCYLGGDQSYWAALELCSVTAAYVDFTTVGTDMNGNKILRGLSYNAVFTYAVKQDKS